jgi:hypothetical protein
MFFGTSTITISSHEGRSGFFCPDQEFPRIDDAVEKADEFETSAFKRDHGKETGW